MRRRSNSFAAERSRRASSMRFAIVTALMCLYFTAAASAPVELTLEECWEGHDHAGLTECVRHRATEARAGLETRENAMRRAIASSAESESYLDLVRKRFEESVRSYRGYRSRQCRLRTALARLGNGAVETELACQAELDTNRADELAQGIWWLKK